MNMNDILKLYTSGKISIEDVSKYLEEINNKVISNFPLVDFSKYKSYFKTTLSYCLDNFNNDDFLKIYQLELKNTFSKVSREYEIKLVIKYLQENFIYFQESVSGLIKEISKFMEFLNKNNIKFDYMMFDKILKENKKMENIIRNLLAPTGKIKYNYLYTVCKKQAVLDFLEILLGIYDIEIEDEIISVKTNGLDTHSLLNHKLLSKEETTSLFLRYKNGDLWARDEILNHNYRLVARLAYRQCFNLQVTSFDDLFQEGVTGLMKAIDKFDLTLDYNFSTYATYWIRQSIQRYIMTNDKIIRIPVHVEEKVKKYYDIKKEMENRLHREVTIAELAFEVGKNEIELSRLLKLSENSVSLDKKIGLDENEDLGFFLKADYDLENDVINRENSKVINEILESLPPREREIIKMRAEIGYNRQYTLNEIGERFNLTRERIRQIEIKAIMLLNRKNLINDQDYSPLLSTTVIKIKFNDYFLGASTQVISSYIKKLPKEYQDIIFMYYNHNLKLIYNYKINSILYNEIIPLLFMDLYELDEDGNTKQIGDLFKDLSLLTIQEYIKEYKLDLITKRYGKNLNEINYLVPEDLKKLYTKQLPLLYNFYISKKTEKLKNSRALKLKYYYLTIEELKSCIFKLTSEEQEFVYMLYGEELNQYNTEYRNKNVVKKLDKIIKNYITEKKGINKSKQKDKSGKVVVVAKAKTFLEKYASYDLEFLRETIDALGEYTNIIYKRYGQNLKEFNELSDQDKAKLMSGLNLLEQKLKENCGKFKEKHLNLLELYPNYSFDELKIFIDKLKKKEQKIIYLIFGYALTEKNYHLKKSEDIEKVLNGLDEIIKKESEVVVTVKVPGKKALFLSEKYPNLSILELKYYVSLLSAKQQTIIFQTYGQDLSSYNKPSKEEKAFLNNAKVRLDEIIKMHNIEQDENLENNNFSKVLKELSVKHYVVYMSVEGIFKNKKYTLEQIAKIYNLELDEVLQIYNEASAIFTKTNSYGLVRKRTI